MSTLFSHRTRFASPIMIVCICLFICLFSATYAYGIDEVTLSTLAGESGFVLTGATVDDIDWDVNPHGGYSATSSKCVTCHSLHGASAAGVSGEAGSNVALLRSSTGCAYCHILGSPASPNGTPEGRLEEAKHVWVYQATGGRADGVGSDGTAVSGHFLGAKLGIPASTNKNSGILGCSTCHVVHGSAASAWLPTDLYDLFENTEAPTSVAGYKFLRANPSQGWRDAGDALNKAVPNNVAEAHKMYGADSIDEVNQFTLSIWCANCHDYAFNPARVPLEDDTFSEEETMTVSDIYLGSIHTDKGTKAISDTHKQGVAHRTPMQGLYADKTGAMECYTCHRAGLSPRGEALDATAINTLPAKYQDAFTVGNVDLHPEARCARCHYGFANYAIDKERLAVGGDSDFPHSATGPRALLGDYLLADSAEPYDHAIITGQAVLDALNTTTNVNSFRAGMCGRCHVVNDMGATGGKDDKNWIEFTRSYHWLEHAFSSEWQLTPALGTSDLHSPGVNP
ncbi:MAG: hypothetical protein FWE87_01725 [Coriobacteriia bacterium]|nr:hypothetical protein [Coriobacteriia bacterium]